MIRMWIDIKMDTDWHQNDAHPHTDHLSPRYINFNVIHI